jgi:hypothetical protein
MYMVIKQTRKEKIKMYMGTSKVKLAEMLYNCNEALSKMLKHQQPISVYPPISSTTPETQDKYSGVPIYAKKEYCVNCDSLLVEAPTDKGHMDCGPHGKICFDCIKKMAFYMQKHLHQPRQKRNFQRASAANVK